MTFTRRRISSETSSPISRSRQIGKSRRWQFTPSLEPLEDRTLLSWTPVSGMPTLRGLLAAALAPDGRIFAFGGTGISLQPLITAQAFNTSANFWGSSTPLIQPTTALAATTGPDGRIYVLGGTTVGGPIDEPFATPTNFVEAYSPATGTWQIVSQLPTARSFLAAATGPDGRIYAIGGYADNGPTNIVEAYSPVTNAWTRVASLPTTPRSALAAVTGPDGRIYAIGGVDIIRSPQPLATVEAYTPATNTWTVLASLPTPRQLLAAAVGPDGRIYAIGGADAAGNSLTTVEAYDIATNTWSAAPSLPTPRSALAAVTGADGRIYAIGGFDDTTPLNGVVALSVPPAPDPRNPAFVSQVYRDLLHRPADPGGLDFYVNALNQGLMTRQQLVLSIEASVEYRTDQINGIYEALLHRPVDGSGLNSFLGLLAIGGTYEQVQESVAGSSEFFADSGGTGAGFLNALYEDALGRAPDSFGRAAFDEFLSEGGSRTEVAAMVYTSLEYRIDLVEGWYSAFLHRQADPIGLDGFVADLIQGARDETVIAAIVGSDEYIGRL
jgi:N-acetylneuraminic acid mutarotase